MIFIVILNYNNFEDTIACLESIKKINGDFTVLLVDNCSNDDSVFRFEKWKAEDGFFNTDNLHLIVSEVNNGYASGNNLGIRYALLQDSCRYIWLLNNDIIVTPDSLSALKLTYRNAIIKESKVAFIGSKVLEYYDRDIIQTAGVKKISLFRSLNFTGKHRDFLENDVEVDYLSGCSMFFAPNLIRDLGYIPEEYFMYYEETDWLWQAKKKNYKNYISANSVIYHKNAASTGGARSPFVVYYMTRNMIVFMRNKNKFIYYVFFVPKVIFRSTVKYSYLFLFYRNLAKPFLQGVLDGLKGVVGKKQDIR